MKNLIYIVIAALFIIWMVSEYVIHTGGSAINLLLVIAIILLSYKLISGEPRRYGRRGLR